MVENIGIDQSRIVGNTEVPEEYFCPICSCLLWKPRSCAGCQQLFCAKCIQTWLLTSETCPFRCPIYNDQRCPPYVLSILSRLKIRCRYESLGCQRSLLYDQLEEHEQSGCTIGTSNNDRREASRVRETNLRRASTWIRDQCRHFLGDGPSRLRSTSIQYIWLIYILVYLLLTSLIHRTSVSTLLFFISLFSLLRMFSINAFNGLRTSQIVRQLGQLLFKSIGTTLALLFWINLMPYYITAIVLLLVTFYTRSLLLLTNSPE